MLKVLAIVPCPQVFGLQIMTLRFFERLSGKINSHFLVTRWTDGEFSRRLDELAIPYSYSWLGMISRKLDRRNLDMTIGCVKKLPVLYRDFMRLVRSYRPDVIYTANYHQLILLWPVLLLLRAPVVYHVHNSLPTGLFYRFSFFFWKRVVDHYLCVSNSVAASVSSLGVGPKHLSLLYNGVDLTRFQYVGSRSCCFSAGYGWPDASVIVGMTGQMGEIKGHFDLLDAARIIHDKHPEVRFVIGGKQDGSYFRQLQERMRENNLDDVVGFSGWQDDMLNFYEGLDIFVFPSRCDEAFGLVIAEAMATGLPVVATHTGGAVEVIEDQRTGIVVERESPYQLSEAISSLVAARSKRVSMGKAGRQRVEQFFDLSKQAAELEKILETVAKSHNRS